MITSSLANICCYPAIGSPPSCWALLQLRPAAFNLPTQNVVNSSTYVTSDATQYNISIYKLYTSISNPIHSNYHSISAVLKFETKSKTKPLRLPTFLVWQKPAGSWSRAIAGVQARTPMDHWNGLWEQLPDVYLQLKCERHESHTNIAPLEASAAMLSADDSNRWPCLLFFSS